MGFFNPQNPGIGGLNELTAAEEAFLTSFAGLSFSNGDILYYNSGALQRLPVGADGTYLTLSSGLPAWASVSGGSIDGSGTTNELTYWVDSDTLGSLTTATYPSLTELSYLKGATSAIQTQINAKFTLPSLTSGSVLFSDGSTISQNNPNFSWDNINIQLKIGSNSIVNGNSLNPIAVAKTSTSYLATYIQNLSSGTAASTDLIIGNNADDGTVSTGTYLDMGINSSGYTGTGLTNGPGDAYIFNNLEDLIFGTGTSGKNVIIGTNIFGGTAASKTRATFTDTGLQMMNGSAANPSISFAGSTTTGFYQSATSTIGVSIAGTSRGTWGASTFSVNSSDGGTIDIGGTSQYMDFGGTITPSANTFQTVRTSTTWTPAENRTNAFAFNNQLVLGGSTTGISITTLVGNRSAILTGSGSTIGFTFTDAIAFEARQFVNNSSGTVTGTNEIGFLANNMTNTVSTNKRGFVGELSSGTTKWNLYMSGNAQNWLAGNLGIGTGISAPTAKLHIAAGSTTASTAPIKLTSGSLMTAPEVGAIEFLTDTYYATITTGVARKSFAFREDKLSVFAATTSAELAGVISDETGSGALMFATSPVITTDITIPNTGLHILDTNASHDLIIAPGSNLTLDRTLTVTTGDTDIILDVTAVTDGYVLTYDTGTNSWRGEAASGGGANTALSNLATVAINTTLVSDTYNTDALGTSAIAWSDLFLGNGAVIDFSTAASTSDVTITHSSNALTLAGGTWILPAVTTTVAPLKFTTGGTLLTTAEDGAIEMDDDCFYGTTDAGNRGVIPVEHIIRANATRTFVSNTAQQAIFNDPTNGTLTLEVGTYLFEGVIAMTSMSATSGNGKFSVIGAGTATLGDILWQAWGNDALAEAAAAAVGGGWHIIATQTAVNIVAAGAATAVAFSVKGTFTVTVAGTIIPSFAQTTASAAVVSIGSFFKCNRIGSTSMVSVGQWT